MNLQFSPVLRKNVIQENKIQMSTDDLTWALKHILSCFSFIFKCQRNDISQKYSPLPYNCVLVIASIFILE